MRKAVAIAVAVCVGAGCLDPLPTRDSLFVLIGAGDIASCASLGDEETASRLDEEDGTAALSLSVAGNGEGSLCPVGINDSMPVVPRIGQLRRGKRHHLFWRSTVEDAPECSAEDGLIPETYRPTR